MSEKENSELERVSNRELISSFLTRVFSIRNEGTDYKGTKEGIVKDIEFKGHSVWILVCSIAIASIGLNMNSTAVIIGAMLISPLMGPILGVGFSMATYSWVLLKKSLVNFGIMVVVSLVTSSLYFWATPINEVTSELLGRTSPTMLDALIAIAGGLAGIIAGSRAERSNVIPGVAIATALMPPLCTAGYGLAMGNWAFFFGAMYLFVINSVFIAAATIVIVRYLRFPVVTYILPERRKRYNAYMTAFILLVLIPSAYLFYLVIQQSSYENRVRHFLDNETYFEKTSLVEHRLHYSRDTCSLDLFFIGEELDSSSIVQLRYKLDDYGLDHLRFQVHQSYSSIQRRLAGELEAQSKRNLILEEMFAQNEASMAEKDSMLRSYDEQIKENRGSWLEASSIQKEVQIQYPKLKTYSLARSLRQGPGELPDTLPLLLVEWQRGLSRNFKRSESQKLREWMQERLKLDTLILVE